MERKHPAAATTESVVFPIFSSPSSPSKTMKDVNYYDEDCDERRKKSTVTHWRLRQRQCSFAVCGMILLTSMGLMTRGYHRRHQERLKNEQQRIFQKFQKDHLSGPRGVRKKYKDLHEMKQNLTKNRFFGVNRKWQQHLKDTKQEKVFEKQVYHETWEPKGAWDQAADGLGAAAEMVGEWMHENAEPIFGADLTHSIADTIHEALDSTGDIVDSVNEVFADEVDEWGQALYEMLGATSESVTTWMESIINATNATETWNEWTTGFYREPAPLWNFTVEQEEEDEDAMKEEEETDQGNPKYEVDSIAFKVGLIKPRKLDKKTDLKFAFVTNGFPVGETQWRLETYVLGALKTWLQDSVLFYVVNTRARDNIQAACAMKENEEACNRFYPIYVNCPTLSYGVSTCCKQDKGMSTIAEVYPKFDWYIYQQDDIFFRMDYLRDFTKELPNPHTEQLLLSASPFRPHGFVQPQPPLTAEAWKEAAKRMKTNCSSSPNHIYPWGRPAVVYSNAALKMVAPGYKKFAISRECNAFEVSADGGSSIVHWMYQIPVVRIPLINHHIPNDLTKQLAFRLTPETKKRGAANPFNFIQRSIGFKADLGRYNFTDIHEAMQNAQKQADEGDGFSTYPGAPYSYNYHRPIGFTETTVFKNHGLPQNWTGKWKTFGPEDCIKAIITTGKNMLTNGQLTTEKREPRNNTHLKIIQEQIIEKVEEAKKAEVRKEFAERKAHRREVLKELPVAKKIEMLKKLDVVKEKVEPPGAGKKKKPKTKKRPQASQSTSQSTD